MPILACTSAHNSSCSDNSRQLPWAPASSIKSHHAVQDAAHRSFTDKVQHQPDLSGLCSQASGNTDCVAVSTHHTACCRIPTQHVVTALAALTQTSARHSKHKSQSDEHKPYKTVTRLNNMMNQKAMFTKTGKHVTQVSQALGKGVNQQHRQASQLNRASSPSSSL